MTRHSPTPSPTKAHTNALTVYSRSRGSSSSTSNAESNAESNRRKIGVQSTSKFEPEVASKQEEIGSNALAFQNSVRDAFTELGEDLDMEEVAIEKEKAMEAWAQRKQMAELRKQMGAELGDLDDKSRKLLEEHAAAMAKKMQALMAGTDNSEEGRAARAKQSRLGSA